MTNKPPADSRPVSMALLREAFLMGEVARGRAPEITGYRERRAREILATLLKKRIAGLERPPSTRTPWISARCRRAVVSTTVSGGLSMSKVPGKVLAGYQLASGWTIEGPRLSWSGPSLLAQFGSCVIGWSREWTARRSGIVTAPSYPQAADALA